MTGTTIRKCSGSSRAHGKSPRTKSSNTKGKKGRKTARATGRQHNGPRYEVGPVSPSPDEFQEDTEVIPKDTYERDMLNRWYTRIGKDRE